MTKLAKLVSCPTGSEAHRSGPQVESADKVKYTVIGVHRMPNGADYHRSSGFVPIVVYKELQAQSSRSLRFQHSINGGHLIFLSRMAVSRPSACPSSEFKSQSPTYRAYVCSRMRAVSLGSQRNCEHGDWVGDQTA